MREVRWGAEQFGERMDPGNRLRRRQT